MSPALVGIERLDLARPDAWVNAIGYHGVAERIGDADRLETIRRYAAELWSDICGIAPVVDTPAEAGLAAAEVTMVLPVVPVPATPVEASPESVTAVLPVVKADANKVNPSWNNEPTAAHPTQDKPYGKFQAFWLAYHKTRDEEGWVDFLRNYGDNWNLAIKAGRIMRGVNPETGKPYPVPTPVVDPQTRAARIARATMEGIRRNKAVLAVGVLAAIGVVSAVLGGHHEATEYIPAQFDLGGGIGTP